MKHLLWAWLLCWQGMAHSATIALILSGTESAYQEAADACQALVEREHRVVRLFADRLDASDDTLSEADMLVTVGVKAADRILGTTRLPVLATLVPKDWHRQKAAKSTSRPLAALVLDQPPARQARLARLALPEATRAGLVFSDEASPVAELSQALRQQRFAVQDEAADQSARPLDSFERIFQRVDLLLAIPDSAVFNRQTIHGIFLMSYRYRKPVIGYSKSLAKAGAMISIYSTPAQIGRQAGELANRILDGERFSGAIWPKYYEVDINSQVARSLGIELPSERNLTNELQASE